MSNSSRRSIATLALGFLFLIGAPSVDSASRVNMHQSRVLTRPPIDFLNEFCDLESKTIRSAANYKQTSDTNSLHLDTKNTLSSAQMLPKKLQQPPSRIFFGFGSSSQPTAPIVTQLNCSIIVAAPESYGLLVNVKSAGLPKNLTRLSVTLNHGSPHAQKVQMEGANTRANYILTQPGATKVAINLQSFEPIDWSHVSFDILFTVYKKANDSGCPTKKWFDCGDNICVPASLVCDNNRNCPNGNDEMVFYHCYSTLFWSIAASTTIVFILVVLIAITILFVRKRRARLNRQHSFSNNVLASEVGDLIHDNNSSKLDLTSTAESQAARGSSSYLASNLYLGGFENPVWTNGTLTKQQTNKPQPPQQQQLTNNQQHQ